MRLQAFDYKVVFISGKQNVADSLSRLSTVEPIPFDPAEEIFIRQIAMLAGNVVAVSWRDIVEASKNDSEIQEVLNTLQHGKTENLPIVYRVIAAELCELQGVVLRGDRIIIPDS